MKVQIKTIGYNDNVVIRTLVNVESNVVHVRTRGIDAAISNVISSPAELSIILFDEPTRIDAEWYNLLQNETLDLTIVGDTNTRPIKLHENSRLETLFSANGKTPEPIITEEIH